MYEYKAKITNVVDGDTFDMDIDLGFYITIHERVRLLEIDTPEKRGTTEKELGLICTKYAKQFEGQEVVIQSEKGTDSFGRWLVYLEFADGTNIIDLYNELGINKKATSYSAEKVRALENESN